MSKKFIISIKSLYEKTGIKKAVTGLKSVHTHAKKITTTFKKGITTVRKWALAITGAAVGAAASVTALAVSAAKFNIEAARASTMAQNMGFKEIRKEALEMSSALGVAKEQISGGIYQALSASVPEENVFSFVSTAAKVAVTDGAEVATVVDGLSTVLNAFKLSADKAEEVADAMFSTVANGKTTFSDLASNMATAAPLAATLGVNFKDVLAATATLTKQGVPTSQALTQIRAAMISTTKVLGDGWSKTMSLKDAFQAVADKSGGSQQKLMKLTGSIEGMNGILGLTGKNSKIAADDVDSITNSLGTLDEKHKIVDEHMQWPKAFAAFDGMKQKIGNVFNETLKPLVEDITKKFEEWRDNQGFWDELQKKLEVARDIVQGMWDAMAAGRGQEVFSDIGALLVAYAEKGAEVATSLFRAAAPEIGQLIGRAAKAVINGPVSRASAINDLHNSGEISYLESASAHMFVPNLIGRMFGDEATLEIEKKISERAASMKMGDIIADSLSEGMSVADVKVKAASENLASKYLHQAQVLEDGVAAISDATADIGVVFDPAVESLDEFFVRAKEWEQKWGTEAEKASQAIGKSTEQAVETMQTGSKSVEAASEKISKKTEEAAKDAAGKFQEAGDKVSEAAGTAGTTVATALQSLGNSVSSQGQTIVNSLGMTASKIDQTSRQTEAIFNGIFSRLSTLEQKSARTAQLADLNQERLQNLT